MRWKTRAHLDDKVGETLAQIICVLESEQDGVGDLLRRTSGSHDESGCVCERGGGRVDEL